MDQQKIEKAEQAKTTPVKEDSKPAAIETPNNTVVETENTKPSTDNKENNNEEIKDKENATTTTEKTVETTNTTTEETIKNNQDNENFQIQFEIIGRYRVDDWFVVWDAVLRR